MLFLSLFALVASPLLQVAPNERVTVRGVSSIVLPPSCATSAILGVDCPGCGLTRSFVHLAHGNWRASIQTHRVGWVLMLAAALQIPYRAHMIWGSGRFKLGTSAAYILSSTLIALLFGNWVLRMCGV